VGHAELAGDVCLRHSSDKEVRGAHATHLHRSEVPPRRDSFGSTRSLLRCR
jgi:hypothetical protein